MSKYTDKELYAKVDALAPELLELSHQIHSKPEITNTEYFACELLSTYLKEKGFTVKTDVCNHPTAFVATYDTNKVGPHLGITAEYDALPGLGHACGHNIMGASSVGAGVVLQDVLTCGKLTVFGTPGEEGGVNGSSKGSFVRDGYLQDVDFSISVHPSSKTQTSSKSIACRVFEVEFFGKPAHAAGSPEDGINALDALINFYNQINALRQQLKDDVRIHGIITDGGQAPNIIPDYTKARFYLRAKTKTTVIDVVEKFTVIAEAAAAGAFATVKVTEIQNAVDNLVPNKRLDQVFYEKFTDLGEDVSKPLDSEGAGSTDVGNISQVVPTVHPTVKIGPDDLVGHTEEFAACARAESGDRGLIIAAKAMVASSYQVYNQPELLTAIIAEFTAKFSGEN